MPQGSVWQVDFLPWVSWKMHVAWPSTYIFHNHIDTDTAAIIFFKLTTPPSLNLHVFEFLMSNARIVSLFAQDGIVTMWHIQSVWMLWRNNKDGQIQPNRIDFIWKHTVTVNLLHEQSWLVMAIGNLQWLSQDECSPVWAAQRGVLP